MAERLAVGEVFAGKYRIDAVLGRGGMGVVLGARHIRLDEPVAIKVLLPEMIALPGMVDRFLREARAASKIKSEHVVRVTDVDVLASGTPYMIMERLEGADLAAICKQRGTLGVDEAVRYVVEACRAIAEAHALGIVHRDLKPANLFLARRTDGSTRVKVLDFGISKIPRGEGDHHETTAGMAFGSPAYMSPEQLLAARDIDGRADLWALGTILYQLLIGRPPFRAEALPQLCTLILHAAPQRPREIRPELPAELEAVILRCLEKDRERRFKSAGELAMSLVPLIEDAPTIARPFSLPGVDAMRPPFASGGESAVSGGHTDPLGAALSVKREGQRGRGLMPVIAGVLGIIGFGGLAVGVYLGARKGPEHKLDASDASAAPAAVSIAPVASPDASASAAAEQEEPELAPNASASAAPPDAGARKATVVSKPIAPVNAGEKKPPVKPTPSKNPFDGQQ